MPVIGADIPGVFADRIELHASAGFADEQGAGGDIPGVQAIFDEAVEATGSHDKLEALVRVLEPFGIKELVQSGAIAVGRGGRSITDRTLRPLERSA